MGKSKKADKNATGETVYVTEVKDAVSAQTENKRCSNKCYKFL